jgi:hypothetical protein
MPAHRLHVTVPEDRRAIVEFPDTVPTGDVELIVLVPVESAETDEPQGLTDKGFPVFAVSPDSEPITPEMVQRAFEES